MQTTGRQAGPGRPAGLPPGPPPLRQGRQWPARLAGCLIAGVVAGCLVAVTAAAGWNGSPHPAGSSEAASVGEGFLGVTLLVGLVLFAVFSVIPVPCWSRLLRRGGRR